MMQDGNGGNGEKMADDLNSIESTTHTALKARIRTLELQLEDVMGQAYQVIGEILHQADMFNHPNAEYVLNYFSLNEYREDFGRVDFSSKQKSKPDVTKL